MRKLRMVEKINGGLRFQEVDPPNYWAAYDAYRADPKNVPAPMVQGHLMFRHPADYGCRLVLDP